jgi:hypothetical protein
VGRISTLARTRGRSPRAGLTRIEAIDAVHEAFSLLQAR